MYLFICIIINYILNNDDIVNSPSQLLYSVHYPSQGRSNVENTHTNTDYTHNRVIIKKGGGVTKEEETETGFKGELFT